MNAVKIVGANGKRRALDFYPTPRECVYALVDFLEIPKDAEIWEPACGGGAIINALTDRGYLNLSGTDIQSGTDFLRFERPGTDWIITNPPFSLAEEFVRHAYDLKVPFAFLLKCQFWHSARRKPLFDAIRPAFVLPLTWRPDFTGQGSSLMDMMWVVWKAEGSAETLYQPLAKPKEG